ncbi:hypothetical protein LSCM1_01839 [Leishmania martiniquensis]|uniref:Uncharacterized protein n=1 Tax=Leishmania martiniquensis TaxID=1580590 RepID=A0A836GBZ8_9TRYP|nr:hypothetical protein LSCM1_01839 [Leishmania martiniquensis]
MMHDYQYDLEVVSVIPAPVLDSSDDGLQRKLILHCTQRDAMMDCATVPSTFEVRNAPGVEFVSIALVEVDRAGGTDRVEASSAEPLCVGGPHRAVGAMWVPLIPRTGVDSGTAASPEVTRVFVAWSMTRMDGCMIRESDLESACISAPLLVEFGREGCSSPHLLNSTHPGLIREPEDAQAGVVEAATAAAVTTATTTDAFPVSSATGNPVLFFDAVAELVVPPLHGAVSSAEFLLPAVTGDADARQGRSSSGSASGPFSAEAAPVSFLISRLLLGNTAAGAARVSIVLDEEEEANRQHIESGSGGGCLTPSEYSRETAVTGYDLLQRNLTEHVKSSSRAHDSRLVSDFAGLNAGNTSVSPVAGVDFPVLDSEVAVTDARTVTWVDYYASSTQLIGPVPIQTRLQNLYTVPSPYLLDRLKDQLAPQCPSPSSPTVAPAPVAAHGLWRERHRHVCVSRWLGRENAAQEEIWHEHEARRGGGALLAGIEAGNIDGGSSSLAVPLAGVKRHDVDVRSESSLTLLLRQALEGLRPRRVMY